MQPDPDIDLRIGRRIREPRAEGDLTLEGLATRTAVSRAMLSRAERRASSPTAQLLVKIRDGLGITSSDLLAPGMGSPVEVAQASFPPGASVTLDGVRFPGADQHPWVLEGAPDPHGADEVVRLEPGGCFAMGFEHPVRSHHATGTLTRHAVVLNRGGPSR